MSLITDTSLMQLFTLTLTFNRLLLPHVTSRCFCRRTDRLPLTPCALLRDGKQ